MAETQRDLFSTSSRFWEKVKIDFAGCWLWTGATNENGYGKIGVVGKTVRAHRLAWELHYGPIPAGLNVLHKCDNPACVRPQHLFLGTKADNSADMATKGRAAKKLTPAAVMEIRAQHAAGQSTTSIATRFGVSRKAVGDVINGRRWSHVE